jgi:hypothetical protein
MFVLEARSARMELGEHPRLRSIVSRLDGGEYRALTESMLRAAEAAAGLEPGSLDADWLTTQPGTTPRRPPPELFFCDASLYVLSPAGKRVDAWEVRLRDVTSRLQRFCDDVTAAALEVGAGGEEDGDIEWREHSLYARPVMADLGPDPEQPALATSDEQRAAAAALADDDARSFITDLVRTGSSITDFDDSPMSQYRSVGELHRHGLIEREYVVVCREDHRTLGRVGDMSDQARQSILQLSCPTCSRRFDEELLRQVHAPSRAAVELVNDGRWRSLWVGVMLRDVGIGESEITELTGSGGNGTALRIDTSHGRLLIELPAAEFGMQHAYALIRRLRRQSVEFGLVLATETVADEAYRYLSDRIAQHQGPMVSVLEGSRAIAEGLIDAIDEWSIISVRMLAEELMETTGMDVGALIEAWMRRVVGLQETTGEIDLRDEDDRGSVTELSRISVGE